MATKLKLGKDEFDPDELDVEWNDDDDFETYDGEQPPTGTVLRGYVKKLWWTYTSAEVPMVKVLWQASGNVGDLEEYNGLPVWENLVFTPKAAFKYGPFLQVAGVTLNDVHTKTYIADDDDSIGAPIEKIGKFVPGEKAEMGVIIKRRKYQGNWQVNAGKFIEQPDEYDDDDEDDEPAEEPKRHTRAAGKPAAKPTPKRRSARQAEPEDDDDADVDDDATDEDDEPDTKPARSARRTTTRATSSRKPAAKPSTRSRRKADDDDDEPF
jgi:hypothetical protein